MNNKNNKWLRELDFLIHECGQSTVVVDSKERTKRLLLEQYRDELRTKHTIFYIDFKTIHNVYDIAEKLSIQYSSIFENALSESTQETINFYRTQKEYDYLNSTLDILKELSEESTDSIILWLENFTEVLKLEDPRSICGMMRSHYQQQSNVTYIFTSNSIDGINAIFNDYDKPFFNSASIIKTYTSEKKLKGME